MRHTLRESERVSYTLHPVRSGLRLTLSVALMSAQRYVAYTSDIGESFRPVAHPNWVRAAYGVSWAYLIGDVTHEGYKAYCRNQETLHPELPREAMHDRYNDAKTDLKVVANGAGVPLKPRQVAPLEDYRTVMAQRALFQGIASMGRCIDSLCLVWANIEIERVARGMYH